jgi:hypothetical protein
MDGKVGWKTEDLLLTGIHIKLQEESLKLLNPQRYKNAQLFFDS